MSAKLEPRPFEVAQPLGPRLSGEELGEGRALVFCHGLTAVRSYVVHGSKLLARRGFRLLSYDARGHGQSDPAPSGGGYSYEELSADLAAVIEAQAPGERVLVAGHSMGAHTAARLGLSRPDLVSGLVLICPAYAGKPPDQDELDRWDRRATALEDEGPEAFAHEAVEEGSANPELLERLALDRIRLHRHPEVVAEALRTVPRSRPFERIDDLAALDLPVLVVASLDAVDLGHPYAVAEAWAAAIPGARLISEAPGESPLAWQGGKLSREIATFAEDTGLLDG